MRLSFQVLAVLVVLSCDRGEREAFEAQPNGPVGITIIDSVKLAESDTAFVARPAGVAVARNGDIFVSDNANKRVYQFTRTGDFVKSIASKGDGPGEVASFGAIVLVDDSTLVINNVARLRIEVFDTPSGQYRWGRGIPARSYQLAADNGTVYTSAPDPTSRSSIASIASQHDSAKRGGVLPALLQRYPILIGPFGTIAHDVRNGRMIEAFEVSDYVYSSPVPGQADSVQLPRLRRRGAAVKELQATATDTSKGRTALYKSSMPMLVRALTDSSAAVVHADVELTGNLFTGKYYLSLVDFKTRQVCLDLPVPVPADPMPRLTMVADTLYAIVQHTANATSSGTYLLRMRVDASVCPWNHVGMRR